MCNLLLLLPVTLAAPAVSACSLNRPTTQFLVTPGEGAVDAATPHFEVTHIGRGKRGASVICNDMGVLTLENRSAHSETTGYRFSIVDGDFEDELFPEYPLITLNGAKHPGRYVFFWLDGAANDQEPFDILVQIVGVSASGEQSEPQLLRVSHEGRQKSWWQFWK